MLLVGLVIVLSQDFGLQGPTLLRFNAEHGIDLGDVPAILLFAAAGLLLWRTEVRRMIAGRQRRTQPGGPQGPSDTT